MGWLWPDSDPEEIVLPEESIQGTADDLIQADSQGPDSLPDSIQGTSQGPDSFPDSIQGSSEGAVPEMADKLAPGYMYILMEWYEENPMVFLMGFFGCFLFAILLLFFALWKKKTGSTTEPPRQLSRSEMKQYRPRKDNKLIQEKDAVEQALRAAQQDKKNLGERLKLAQDSQEQERKKNQQEIEDLKQKVQRRDDEMQELRRDNRQHAAKLERKYKEADQRLKTQESDLKAQEEKVSKLQKELIDARAQAQKARTQTVIVKSGPGVDDQLKAKFEELKKQNEENIMKIKALEEKELELEEIIRKKDEKLAEKNREMSRMGDKLNEKDMYIKEQKEQIANLKKEIQALNKRNSDTLNELADMTQKKEEQTLKANQLEARNAELQKELQTERRKRVEVRAWVDDHLPRACTVPAGVHGDVRMERIVPAFMARVNARLRDNLLQAGGGGNGGAGLELEVVAGPDIGPGHMNPVLLPCIAASRVGSDISGAIGKARIDKSLAILVVFHHVASHKIQLGTPTEQRLSDKSLLQQCLGVVDVVYWQGELYDCPTNTQAVDRLVGLLRWGVTMEEMQELERMLQDQEEEEEKRE